MSFGNYHFQNGYLCIFKWLHLWHRVLLEQLVDQDLRETKEVRYVKPGSGGGGVLPEKLGRGVRPASQNTCPIYDQNLRYSLPYLWPKLKFETLFMTCFSRAL